MLAQVDLWKDLRRGETGCLRLGKVTRGSARARSYSSRYCKFTNRLTAAFIAWLLSLAVPVHFRFRSFSVCFRVFWSATRSPCILTYSVGILCVPLGASARRGGLFGAPGFVKNRKLVQSSGSSAGWEGFRQVENFAGSTKTLRTRSCTLPFET